MFGIIQNLVDLSIDMYNEKYDSVEASYKLDNIIDELDLHLEVENSLGGFYETSCDVVQKINNYLWLSEKEALQ